MNGYKYYKYYILFYDDSKSYMYLYLFICIKYKYI